MNKERLKAIGELLLECTEEEPDRVALVFGRTKKSPEELVDDMLLELGVPDALSGHKYLKTAILMGAEDDSWLCSVTSELYPEIARRHENQTKAGVERSMRHAIFVASDRCDMDVFNKFFRNTVSSSKGAPTVREFIGRCAAVLRKQVSEK